MKSVQEVILLFSQSACSFLVGYCVRAMSKLVAIAPFLARQCVANSTMARIVRCTLTRRFSAPLDWGGAAPRGGNGPAAAASVGDDRSRQPCAGPSKGNSRRRLLANPPGARKRPVGNDTGDAPGPVLLSLRNEARAGLEATV